MRSKIERGSGRPIGKLFLILFSLFFFMILGTIFISYSFNTKNITQRDLYKGEDFNLNDNDSLSLRFDKERHVINLTIFGLNSVDITVHSEPITKHIKINESVFFDLNNDSENDLKVWLKEIVNYNAIIEFKRIDGVYCVPEWECEKWGSCIDGLRKRTCSDVRLCGKSVGIPELEKFCSNVLNEKEIPEEDLVDESLLNKSENINSSQNISVSNETEENKNNELYYYNPESDFFIGDGDLTCLDNEGEVCLEGQKCQGKWINVSDSLRCCFGECYFSEIDLMGLNSSISCDKSITSFRLAVYGCIPFVMSCVENVLVFELGIVHGFESVFEIQGYSSGNNCLFEYGYGNVFLNYTKDKYDELYDEGKTIGQINFELESLETEFVNKFEDKSMVCKYPQDEFLVFARAWEEGRIEWSRDILGKYECSGNLVGL